MAVTSASSLTRLTVSGMPPRTAAAAGPPRPNLRSRALRRDGTECDACLTALSLVGGGAEVAVACMELYLMFS